MNVCLHATAFLDWESGGDDEAFGLNLVGRCDTVALREWLLLLGFAAYLSCCPGAF